MEVFIISTEQELAILKQSVIKNQYQKSTIQFICKACGVKCTRRLLCESDELLCAKCKGKQTTLKHWGVENPSQAKEIKQKKKDTTFKHYGVENPM